MKRAGLICAKDCGQLAEYDEPEPLCALHWALRYGENHAPAGDDGRKSEIAAAALATYVDAIRDEIRDDERRFYAEHQVEFEAAREYGHVRVYLNGEGFFHCLGCDHVWHPRLARVLSRCAPKPEQMDDSTLEGLVNDTMVSKGAALSEPLMTALKRLAARAHAAGVQAGRILAQTEAPRG